jgi:hypothetical protein
MTIAAQVAAPLLVAVRLLARWNLAGISTALFVPGPDAEFTGVGYAVDGGLPH